MSSIDFHKFKIALVTEQLDQRGGGSRFIESVYKNVLPNATIFAPFIDYNLFPHFRDVKTSFLQKKIFRKTFLKQATFYLLPLAYEQFSFEGYDLVVTIGYGATRSVISGIDQPQVSIIFSPSRYQWDKTRAIKRQSNIILRRLTEWLLSFFYKMWDVTSINRPDYIYTISNYIAKKIKKIYRVDSRVIYPGVDPYFFKEAYDRQVLSKILADFNIDLPDKYFYIVSRLYDYKKIDVAIKACNKTKKNLIIAGIGPDLKYLKSIADSQYITFLGYVSAELNRALYANAEAFLFPGYEDFGYTPVESMATGTPVIYYNKGGVKETVCVPECGLAFDNLDELINILKTFDKENFNKSELKKQADKFSEKLFIENIKSILEKALKTVT